MESTTSSPQTFSCDICCTDVWIHDRATLKSRNHDNICIPCLGSWEHTQRAVRRKERGSDDYATCPFCRATILCVKTSILSPCQEFFRAFESAMSCHQRVAPRETSSTVTAIESLSDEICSLLSNIIEKSHELHIIPLVAGKKEKGYPKNTMVPFVKAIQRLMGVGLNDLYLKLVFRGPMWAKWMACWQEVGQQRNPKEGVYLLDCGHRLFNKSCLEETLDKIKAVNYALNLALGLEDEYRADLSEGKPPYGTKIRLIGSTIGRR